MTTDMRSIRTPERARAFTDALSDTGNVSESCKISGLGRRSVYEWKADDPEFSKEWEKALEIGIGALEDEARRRACDGVERPVYQGGQCVGYVRDYSDRLLIFLLKGAKPQKYRDNVAMEHSGPAMHVIEVGSVLDRPAERRESEAGQNSKDPNGSRGLC